MTDAVILASGSPRRAQLLKQIGLRFAIKAADINEDDLNGHGPGKHTEILAERKARAVACENPESIVIGADTVVFCNGKMLGKPKDKADAFHMLESLSGSTHQVYTGYAIILPDASAYVESVCTDVTFRTLEKWEIKRYIESGLPMDKAGAYGIQDSAATFVESVKGCYFNVVGLPISRFFCALKKILGQDGLKGIMSINEY